MTRIRARQGHSIHVDVELEEKLPPDILYHGTGERFVNSILDQGINKGNRLYVHLSETKRNCSKRWKTTWQAYNTNHKCQADE